MAPCKYKLFLFYSILLYTHYIHVHWLPKPGQHICILEYKTQSKDKMSISPEAILNNKSKHLNADFGNVHYGERMKH